MIRNPFLLSFHSRLSFSFPIGVGSRLPLSPWLIFHDWANNKTIELIHKTRHMNDELPFPINSRVNRSVLDGLQNLLGEAGKDKSRLMDLRGVVTELVLELLRNRTVGAGQLVL